MSAFPPIAATQRTSREVRFVPTPEVAFTVGLLPSASQKPREAVVTQLPAMPTRAAARSCRRALQRRIPSQAIQEKGEWRDAHNVEACKQARLKNRPQQGDAEAVIHRTPWANCIR